MTTFHEATRQLMACAVSLDDVADEADVAVLEIRHSRLDPSNASYEGPPPHWREALVSLARKRVVALQAFADELERESPDAAASADTDT